jgi:hypothetical protein
VKKSAPAGSFAAFTGARTDLTGRAQVTRNGSTYVNGWRNTSGSTHREHFLKVDGL